MLIIPEDPTLDRFILEPIVKRIFKELGREPWVETLSNPRLRGVAQALNRGTLEDIIATRRMIDLFLVLVDRDGDEGRLSVARQREAEHRNRGAGRAWAMREVGARWKGVVQCCPELKELRARIEEWLKGR